MKPHELADAEERRQKMKPRPAKLTKCVECRQTVAKYVVTIKGPAHPRCATTPVFESSGKGPDEMCWPKGAPYEKALLKHLQSGRLDKAAPETED